MSRILVEATAAESMVLPRQEALRKRTCCQKAVVEQVWLPGSVKASAWTDRASPLYVRQA